MKHYPITFSYSTNVITDPGVDGAIPVTTSGVVSMATAKAADTRTLVAPTYVNQNLTLTLTTVTTPADVITLTSAVTLNATGNNTALFDTAAQSLVLLATEVGTTLVWRIQRNTGSVTLSTV